MIGVVRPDFGTTWAKVVRRVDAALDRHLPGENVPPRELHRAMRYSVFAGGKRLRPVLCILSGRLAGAKESALLAPACALEMVHTYSLIHDDLPAMDDDDFRRGKPTCHRVFGDGLAILAGDGLLTLAFETIARKVRDGRVAAKLCEELALGAGHAGMAGGQAFDILGEKRRPDARLVKEIHRRKTAALIRASVRMGAIAGEAPASMLRDLTRFGEDLGLLFQVTDDILDETGVESKMGKKLRKDAERGKQTYPRVHGLDKSRQVARQLAQRCDAVIGKYGRRAGILLDMPRFVLERSS
jgi:geranylgeranyl diphosphate synthase type II